MEIFSFSPKETIAFFNSSNRLPYLASISSSPNLSKVSKTNYLLRKLLLYETIRHLYMNRYSSCLSKRYCPDSL